MEINLGPIQYEDVLLLQAVIRMTYPKQLVELGYLNGYSTRKLLEVMTEDARLTSYDNTVSSSDITDPRFTFKNKSQTECDEKGIEFIFFDASHDLEINKQTFENLDLAEHCIIAVHDTGLWNRMVMDTGGYWIGDGYAHRPGEIAFVQWLKEKGYNAINFHTLRETRHGMTLLQK